MSIIAVRPPDTLVWNNKELHAALGKNGVSEDKRERDGATPAGCFHMRAVYFRPDRLEKPETKLPVHALTPEDAWCDDPAHPEYNTFVRLPHAGSHEKLWREDEVYDIIVPLGYNDDPPIPGKGSAIFMHIARPNYSPTAGCIALSRENLLEILKEAGADTQVCIESKEQVANRIVKKSGD